MLRYEEHMPDEDTGNIRVSPIIFSLQPGRLRAARLLFFLAVANFRGIPYNIPCSIVYTPGR